MKPGYKKTCERLECDKTFTQYGKSNRKYCCKECQQIMNKKNQSARKQELRRIW